ncbi:hypothetical protein AVEN_126471-1 [Araneus ventricosus]|uniref:Uncharacterized protein n=1 Tax=Araneus ventricosus TaxID=182803 RepID=A0A4Y2DJ30_ARAVE|nr:hypothetical protein AVEN_126471-1 [Araneus ventricosus]
MRNRSIPLKFVLTQLFLKPSRATERRGENSAKLHWYLDRLGTAKLQTLIFSRGDKKFNICTKCDMIEATPQHLLDCVALVHDDLLKRPDFVLEVMKANDLMDLI